MTDTAPTGPSILIGRCTVCKRTYRAEIPSDWPVWPSTATRAAYAAGYSVRCDCREGVRCPEDENGCPSCWDWRCDGHWFTQIEYRPLRITYKPGAVCGPGNCWGARSSECTCSCRGEHHGRKWEVVRA
jgi:hypothetical protein